MLTLYCLVCAKSRLEGVTLSLIDPPIYHWPGGARRPPTPSEEYDFRLLSLGEAAEISGISLSYLRVVVTDSHRLLISGRQRLRTMDRGGAMHLTTRRWLHIFLMTRAISGKGSGNTVDLPDYYVYPPYNEEDMAELQQEIDEVRQEMQATAGIRQQQRQKLAQRKAATPTQER